MKRRHLLVLVSVLWLGGCGSSGGDADTGTGTDTASDGIADQRGDAPFDVVDEQQPPIDLNQDKGDQPDESGEMWIPPDTHTDGITPDYGDAGDWKTDLEIPDEFEIEIVTPEEGVELTGSTVVRIVPKGVEELRVDYVWLFLDDLYLIQDTKLPTEFVLDTTRHKLPGFMLRAEARIGPKTAQDSVSVTINNPSWSLKRVYADEYRYKNGEEVSLFVETGKAGMVLTGDFGALDSAYEAGDEEIYEIGGGKYMINYTISGGNAVPDGVYNMLITASDTVFTLEFPHLQLALNNRPTLPVRVERGIFVSSDAPATTQDWEEQPISLVYGSDFVITGGSASVNVDFSGYPFPSEIVGIIIGVDGYAGHYVVPLEGSLGEEELMVLMRVYLEGETPPAKLPLRIGVKDVRGRISAYMTQQLSVQSVGSGDIQVSVSWDTETDVDLHVIEPGGCELYYGHKQCVSGGWLDLDSNPACSIDHIKNENVFWPDGQAPVGTYTVKVDFYQDCDYQGANYTVTLHYCGEVETYQGDFAPGTSDSGGAGDGVEVAKFNNDNCGRILRGRVRYEDRTFSKTGFSASTWKPVRYAAVDVKRASDNTVLASGYTDRDGNYEIQFSNKEEPGIYITAKARTNKEEGLRDIAVMNHPKFKQLYNVSSQVMDETVDEFPVLNLDIPEVVSAGAFNIFDVVVDGYDLIRLMTGSDLGLLNVYWATGADTTDTLFCAQYLYETGVCSEFMALSVQGKDTDRDEYDDMVILKEFFKFALARVSKDSNPGGLHDGTRDDPRRSWSEGVSTFFACDVMRSRYFVNSKPQGVFLVDDLEGMLSPFAFKTINDVQSGNVSEYLVAAVLWDMVDSSGDEESFDAVHGRRLGVFDAIFHYFSGGYFADRGVPGVDFVDFLDAWFCRGWSSKPAVQGLLENRQFPFDFAGPASCIH